MLFFTLVVVVTICVATCLNVTFDNRAFLLDGQRTLFIGGSIHYPRAHSSEWPSIIQQAKLNGINLIQTYVFWDIHEPEDGVFYFPSDGSNADIVAFIKECQAQGIYVNLRFGPYVCAEWNYGGFPVWLRGIDGIEYRTMNEPFMAKMTRFVDQSLKVVKDANLLASDGGPIVMLQIENEYGNMEHYYPKHGADYVQWAAEYATAKNLPIPWIMCQQGEGVGTAPPANIINTCNGYYCDNWISQHEKDFPNQPHMWTENWPGWFQHWGEAVPHRPAVDVAFAVARWYARGGSFSNYYMAFGGTTFGRQVGGPLIVTSYDYDVQINEFGLPAEPKFSLLSALHSTLNTVAPVLLSHDSIPPSVALTSNCDSITYDDSKLQSAVGCVTFLSNVGSESSCTFTVQGQAVSVPPWSVSIVTDSCNANAKVVHSTRNTALDIPSNQVVAKAIEGVKVSSFETFKEPIPSTASAPVLSSNPPDQLTLTQDNTDYMWVSSTLPARHSAGESEVSFFVGEAGGPVLYVYVNGKLAASTIDTTYSNATLHGHAGSAGPHSNHGTQLTEHVQRSTHASSKRKVETAVMSEGSLVRLSVQVPAGRSNRLDILYTSTGIKNYGPYLELVKVGITSAVYVDGVALSSYSSVAGLNGEATLRKSALDKVQQSLQDQRTEANAPLTWYTATFPTPSTAALEQAGSQALAVALDISGTTLVKGAVWVNDVMLGRYWNILAGTSAGACDDAAACTSEAYVGGYGANKCRTGCGSLSQSLYKVPLGLLHSADSGVPNKIVFFEELGGSPQGVAIKAVSMANV